MSESSSRAAGQQPVNPMGAVILANPEQQQLEARAWPALWSLVIGFFMILVDSTIVSVATPSIMNALNADISQVVWVTSAYLLAYAVPLLITGRLGDRFGPKRMYLAGLVIFTLASAWCGLAGDVTILIIARVVQGLGAALMTPQTMSMITRMFPAQRRGAAMGLWGSVAGVAILVGPVLGGILVDLAGWEWIFYINVPIGVIGFVLAVRLVPALSTQMQRFDWIGVLLSGAGMFFLVFGIQEGESFNWGAIAGPISVWSLIISGLVLMVIFVLWQHYQRSDPLVPLRLFRDRNFSLATLAIAAMGFVVTSMSLPLMLYAQEVRGLAPTQAALLLAPMAVISGVLAPFVGKLINRRDPRYLAVLGFALISVSLFWLGSLLRPETPVWMLLLPMALLGFANAGIWAPVSLTATRNLTPDRAGAGSGVYNTTRQVGAVLGAAMIASLMQARLNANMPHESAGAGMDRGPSGGVPEFLQGAFAGAMGESLLLPAAVILVGLLSALCFARPVISPVTAGNSAGIASAKGGKGRTGANHSESAEA